MQQKEVVKNERCTFYSLFFYGIVSILKQWGHVMAANRIDFAPSKKRGLSGQGDVKDHHDGKS